MYINITHDTEDREIICSYYTAMGQSKEYKKKLWN